MTDQRIALIALLALSVLPVLAGTAAPVAVRIETVPGGYQLLRDGAPYYIRGAGGSGHLEELVRAGGNSIRTWGIEQTEAVLPEANRLGLTVTAGLWIEHERHGFDYDDEAAVRAQVERHKASIERVREDPAILIWAIGNEVWIEAQNLKVWDAIEAVAAHVKQVDPLRPTMTVLPHVSKTEVAAILSRCPSIDILGINSYGGIHVVMEEARKAGWCGPVVIAEWGTNGGWEVDKTPWGAEIEPTSTEKALQFALRYSRILENRNCIGSYVFLWGHKQEITSTWFNLFLDDRTATAVVDVMQYLWSGTAPARAAPVITPLLLNGKSARAGPRVRPGAALEAAFTLVSPEPDAVTIRWECLAESTDKRAGGDAEKRPPAKPVEFEPGPSGSVRFTAPERPGPYRLFVYVHSDNDRAATANIPFMVE